MNKEFIPYEQALELKELGFDEECLGWHNSKRLLIDNYNNYNSKMPFEYCCSVPLYQQAFDFFIEEYNFCCFIRGNNYDGYKYDIDGLGILRYKFEIENRISFKTYPEAELACLKKLIEIAKNK
jgi:hypothetical protein